MNRCRLTLVNIDVCVHFISSTCNSCIFKTLTIHYCFYILKLIPNTSVSWVFVTGMFREVSPGYRGSPEQRTADGSLPSTGQLHSCPAAQPQPQNEPGGMFDMHVACMRITLNYHSIILMYTV